MIEDSLPYMLGGTSRLNFNPDGVECVTEFLLPEAEARCAALVLRNSNMPVSLNGLTIVVVEVDFLAILDMAPCAAAAHLLHRH